MIIIDKQQWIVVEVKNVFIKYMIKIEFKGCREYYVYFILLVYIYVYEWMFVCLLQMFQLFYELVIVYILNYCEKNCI